MKFVMICHVTDGFTYGYDLTIPFEYESKETFLYDLLEETLRAVDKKDLVRIVGNEFYVDCFGFFNETRPGMKNPKIEFEFSEPRVYELEEWFKINAGKP